MLIPVLDGQRVIGHMIETPRGYRTFDSGDRELGMFGTAQGGALALQKLANPARRRTASLRKV
jgi:hypothetical protein